MFLSSPGERNTSPTDSKTPIRGAQGSNKLVVGTTVNDENLQNYRIQIAVNRYNNTKLPPFRQQPMSAYRCSVIRTKSPKSRHGDSPLSGEFGDGTQGAHRALTKPLQSRHSASDEVIKQPGPPLFKRICVNDALPPGSFQSRFIMKAIVPQNSHIHSNEGNSSLARISPELRYTGPDQFPTCHINKTVRLPVKKQNILSLLNAHGTGLPVARYMDDSAEKYSDFKSTRSVLEVLQDMSRKRMRVNDDIDEGIKRRCNGLGGDLVQEGEVPYSPLFVPKTRHSTLPRKDQCTQTFVASKDCTEVTSPSSNDPKSELRKKLACKNNAISASLSSSARGLMFASRKRAAEAPVAYDIGQAGTDMSKKSRVSDKSALSPSLKNTTDNQRIDKPAIVHGSPKSPERQDRFMTIYLDLQNTKDTKLNALKTIHTSPSGNQFLRPEESNIIDNEEKTKSDNSDPTKMTLKEISPSTTKAESPFSSNPASSLKFLVSNSCTRLEGMPPVTVITTEKEEKVPSQIPNFKYLASPVTTAPLPVPTSPCDNSVLSSPSLPSSPLSSITSVTTSVTAPVVTAVSQESSQSPPKFNISDTFKFSPMVRPLSTSKSSTELSFKASTPTKATSLPYSFGQSTVNTTSTTSSVEKAPLFTFGNSPKNVETAVSKDSGSVINTSSPAFKFENPVATSTATFSFPISNFTFGSAGNKQQLPISTSTTSAATNSPNFAFGMKKEVPPVTASSPIPAPFHFGKTSSESTNIVFGDKSLGVNSVPTVTPQSQTFGGFTNTPDSKSYNIVFGDKTSGVNSVPAVTAQRETPGGFLKTHDSSVDHAKADGSLKWFNQDSTPTDTSKSSFIQVSQSNNSSAMGSMQPVFGESISCAPSTTDSSSKPVFGNSAPLASSMSDVSKHIFGMPNTSSQSEVSKPVFQIPTTYSQSDVLKPVFGISNTSSQSEVSKPVFEIPHTSSQSEVSKPVFEMSNTPSQSEVSKPLFGMPNTFLSSNVSKAVFEMSQPNTNSNVSNPTSTSASMPVATAVFGQFTSSVNTTILDLTKNTSSDLKTITHNSSADKQKPLSVFSRLGDRPSSSTFSFGNPTSGIANAGVLPPTSTQESFSNFKMPVSTTTPSQLSFGQSLVAQTASSTAATETWSFGQTFSKGGPNFGGTTPSAANKNLFGANAPESFGSGSSVGANTQALGFGTTTGGTSFKVTTSIASNSNPVFVPNVTPTSTVSTTANSSTGPAVKPISSFTQSNSIFGSGFGQKTAGFGPNPATTLGFTFGQTAITTTSSYGQSSTNPFGPNTSSGFASASFNNSPTTTASTNTATTQAPSFASSTPFGSSSQQPFGGGFGQPSGGFGQVPSAAFNHPLPSTTPATNQTFVFGKNTAPNNEPFAFGGNPSSTAATSAFGSATSNSPTFGSTATKAASPFGSNPQQPFISVPVTTTPMAPSLFTFGAGNKLNPIGYNFNTAKSSEQPQNTPFAFGGSGGSSTSSNSSASSTGFNFTASALTPGSTFSFGASGNNPSNAAFGSSSTPAFGQNQQSVGFPAFGQPSTPGTFGTFSIGSGPTQSRSRAPARRRGRQ